jgi:UDP-N-acetylglucosamine 3-dehydrogenase
MAELSVAIAGCGAAGNVHLACWNNLVGVRIAAVCDIDGMAAARTAAQYEGAAAFTSVSDMLKSQRFDIVDVCTPAAQHVETAAAALRAGAHVLCEKPLAVTANDARAIVQLAQERERLLMTAFTHRFHPPVLFAKEMVDNDDIGRVTMFRCRFSGYFEGAEGSALSDPDQSGGGALLDTAINGIDLFRYFCGEAASITGRLMQVNPDLRVEDAAALLIEGETGALGVVEASWSQPGGRNVVEIYGTAGACIVDYDTGVLRYLTADQPFYQHREEGGPNRFERQVAHFADAVRGLQPLLVTGEDGLRAVELCEEVYRQNRRNL